MEEGQAVAADKLTEAAPEKGGLRKGKGGHCPGYSKSPSSLSLVLHLKVTVNCVDSTDT